MRTRQTMTISLPPEMIMEVERVRNAEHRTRSELIREALRTYFKMRRTLPEYTPTPRELRDIEKGRSEFRRGEYSTLDELRAELASQSRKVRSKAHRSRASS